jgi:DNA-directed RNA polymerase II subunit RPB2
MPFTDEGIRPDLIINPHALPSRMTIGQLVETLMGKACLLYGGFGDCTAFVNKGSKHYIFGNLLKDIGYNSTGNEIFYNGESGEQIQMEMFVGPCYYMRLKHMVKDKINYRARGPRTVLTRQTVQGRANDGGLRIGEMERDCIIAHGASYFLQESMLNRGDEYYVAVCNNTGTIAIYNEAKNLFISPFCDGPLVFNTNIDESQNIEVITKFGRDFSIIKVPYAFKLLLQELQVMNIQMRIITDANVDQLTSLNNEHTLKVLNNFYNKPLTKDEEILRKDLKDLKDLKEEEQEQEEDDDISDKTLSEVSDTDSLNTRSKKISQQSIRKAEQAAEEEISSSDDEVNEPLKFIQELSDSAKESFNNFVEVITPKNAEINKPEINKPEVNKPEIIKPETEKSETEKSETNKSETNNLETDNLETSILEEEKEEEKEEEGEEREKEKQGGNNKEIKIDF